MQNIISLSVKALISYAAAHQELLVIAAAILFLLGMGVAMDYQAALQMHGYELDGMTSYAQLCREGVDSACEGAATIQRWAQYLPQR